MFIQVASSVVNSTVRAGLVMSDSGGLRGARLGGIGLLGESQGDEGDRGCQDGSFHVGYD